MKNKQKGFTLVELLVVVAIIAILATVSVIGYLSFTEKARKSVDESLCTQYNNLLKAEQTSDNDITLGEFILYIEENGINSNHFNTSSKSYVFAYDKGNTTCVLLNANDSTVAYPKNHTAEELWMVYPDGPKLQPKVYNYTLLTSKVLNSAPENMEANQTYTLDLNGHMLVNNINTLPAGTTLKAINKGMLVDNTNNLQADATITKPAANKVTVSTDQKDNKLTTKLQQVSENVNGEYFAATYTITSGNRVGNPTINLNTVKASTTANRTLTFTNTVFTGVGITIEKMDNYDKVVFDGCTFINLNPQTNAISIGNSNVSLEVKNCKFHDITRGINASVPATGVERNIHDNEFIFNKVITDKGERKDVALQINASTPFTTYGTVKFVNNSVKKGLAAMNLHDGFVTVAHDKTTVEAFLNTVVMTGNTLGNGVQSVVVDQGVKEDKRAELQAYVDILVAKFNK